VPEDSVTDPLDQDWVKSRINVPTPGPLQVTGKGGTRPMNSR